jgi:hypothetical protein
MSNPYTKLIVICNLHMICASYYTSFKMGTHFVSQAIQDLIASSWWNSYHASLENDTKHIQLFIGHAKRPKMESDTTQCKLVKKGRISADLDGRVKLGANLKLQVCVEVVMGHGPNAFFTYDLTKLNYFLAQNCMLIWPLVWSLNLLS